MIPIDNALLDSVVRLAQGSPRQRANHNFHTEMGDTLQRMLNAIEPGTYVRPHKHQNPDKREAFIILRGRAVVFLFDNEGLVNQAYILDKELGQYGIEIPPGEYHSLASLESGTVVYELKDGPYNPSDDKCFGPWSPAENEDGALEYLDELLNRIRF